VRDYVAAAGERSEERLAVGNRDGRQERYARRHAATLPYGKGHKRLATGNSGTMFGLQGNPRAVLKRGVRHLVFIGALAMLVLPAPAFASADQVIRDCSLDGKLDHHYSNAELRRARDHMPSDLDEYSDCRDVIGAAIKGGSDISGGKGSPGIAASNPVAEQAAKAADQQDLSSIASSDKAPKLDVGGNKVAPDSSGFFNLGGAANQVPLPLLIALLLLCTMALVSGLGSARQRLPALTRIPLLSKIPSLRVPFFGRRG
jgi:hypothetical protein